MSIAAGGMFADHYAWEPIEFSSHFRSSSWRETARPLLAVGPYRTKALFEFRIKEKRLLLAKSDDDTVVLLDEEEIPILVKSFCKFEDFINAEASKLCVFGIISELNLPSASRDFVMAQVSALVRKTAGEAMSLNRNTFSIVTEIESVTKREVMAFSILGPKMEKSCSVQTEKEMDRDCSICLDSISRESQVLALPCSHAFHQLCINRWLEKKKSCPMCRFQL